MAQREVFIMKERRFSLLELVIIIWLGTAVACNMPRLIEEMQHEKEIQEVLENDIVDVPAGYTFVEWAVKDKSYVIEDRYGDRTIVIIELD